MHIRLATPAHAPALAQLASRLFYQAYSDTHEPADLDAYVAEHFPLARVELDLAKPTSAWFVVEDGSELIGYAELRNRAAPPGVGDQPSLELGRFYVDAAWHGRGIAATLMQAVAAEARHRGAEQIWLVVWADNERAKAFYIKHGFTKVGTAPYQIGGRIYDDDLMRRALDA